MKLTIIALLKFNALMGALVFALVLIIESSSNGREPSATAMIFTLLILGAWVFWNLKIIINNRNRISNSIKNGALDVAATAIQFKEAAKARAHERAEERNK